MSEKLKELVEELYKGIAKLPLEEQRKACYRLNYKVTQAFKEKGINPHGRIEGKSTKKKKKKK